MKKYISLLLFSSIFFFSFSPKIDAKIAAPTTIPSIEHNSREYRVVHYSAMNEKMDHNGGYIQVIDTISKKEVALIEIYPVVYDSSLEKDVQEVFITDVKKSDGKLFVENEKNELYLVDLETYKVQKQNNSFFSCIKKLIDFYGVFN